MSEIAAGEPEAMRRSNRTDPVEAQPDSEPREVGIASLSDLVSLLTEAVEALKTTPVSVTETGVDFYAEVRRFEIALISRALRQTSGSQIKAASLLNLRRTTLNTKIKMYQINPADEQRNNGDAGGGSG